jgi:hypothetical protein
MRDICSIVDESLSTVAALKQKSLALCHFSQLLPDTADLIGCHDWRKVSNCDDKLAVRKKLHVYRLPVSHLAARQP